MGSINRFLYVYIIIFEHLFFVNSRVKDENIFPNLPAGEYRIKYKAIVKCVSSPGNKIHHHLYFSKLSTNTVAFKGNLTYEISIDDYLSFHINFAIKDSVGAWKDNAHIISLKKACTSLKNYMGEQWSNYTKSFGIKDQNCPIQPGVYVSTERGYDLSYVATLSSFPKVFFYGTYKCRVYYKDVYDVQHGCINFIVEIIRPWETE